MVQITLDESSKLVLQYSQRVRETIFSKKKHAVRPSEFPNIDLQQLCDTLIRRSYSVGYIDRTFRDHLMGLIDEKTLLWYHILRSVCNTTLTDLYMKCQLCELIRAVVPRVQLRSFSQKESTEELNALLKPTFDFLVRVLLDVLSDEEQIITWMVDHDNPEKAYLPPLLALNTLIHDEFCRTILILHCKDEVQNGIQEVYDAFSDSEEKDDDAIGVAELLMELFDESMQLKKFEYVPQSVNVFNFKNPSIKVLISIFACFKYEKSSSQIGETIITFAKIMNASPTEVIFDLLHAAYLIKCEESIDSKLLHLPNQHRLDFRWQSSTFFYQKLPEIILHMGKTGFIKLEDLVKGLEMAYKEFTMMIDIADKSWQNASFLTLLKTIEGFLGEQTMVKLRDQRREHMKTIPEMIPLSESDETVVDGSDIQFLIAAAKIKFHLMSGDEDEFYKQVTESVSNGEFDLFDAVTSMLGAEGLLMQMGKMFVTVNQDAQTGKSTVENRMETFDETFLVLTRILLKHPSLPIKLFATGGPIKLNRFSGELDRKKSIFFKWAMSYVKRVFKAPKLEENEENLEMKRQESAMLIRIENAEVGIEEDFEEPEEKNDEKEKEKSPEKEGKLEEDKIKKEGVEQEKEGETIKEENETTEEDKMDTSEAVDTENPKSPIENVQMETKNAPGFREAPNTDLPDNIFDDDDVDLEPPAAKRPRESLLELLEQPSTSSKREKSIEEQVAEEMEKMLTPSLDDKPAEPEKTVTVVTDAEKKPEEVEKTLTEVAKPKRRKYDIPMTWQSFEHPLPRISKKVGKEYLMMLKEGVPFWDVNNDNLNFGALLAAIPVIGQHMLDEHEDKRHRADKRAAEETMIKILRAVAPMTCLIVCLVEWLDCEPESSARTSLAISIQQALVKCSRVQEDANRNKWNFILLTLEPILLELIDKSLAFPEVTCSVFSTARRYCPFVFRNEKPDQLKLKHGWYYMRQQGWASPHALRLLEHSNAAGDYNTWSHIYLNKVMKNPCGDLMEYSVDMIFCFLMMDHYDSVIRMHESLMDFWLSEDDENQLDGRHDPSSMRAILRLMTHVMILAEWTILQLKRELNVEETPTYEGSLETPKIDDPEASQKWLYLLNSTLDRTVNRFKKILRPGLLSTVANTIVQLMKSIAGSNNCEAKELLIKRISPDVIFQLAYIEPSAVDFPLMLSFCENGNKEHDRLKILFLCALRRCKCI